MNNEIRKLWSLMKENNAGVMKIVMDSDGIEASRMIIFVDGVQEVAEIKTAIAQVEDSDEIVLFDAS